MIPGPIELEPAVLAALAERQRGHLDPLVMKRFSRALRGLRTVFGAPTAQPFVVAGSGTLAMELAVANLVEPGTVALVINTGYFSDRMALALTRHGAEVRQVTATPGQVPSDDEVRRALELHRPQLVTITHVDTSTGVRAPVEAWARLIRAHGALSVVDGVCSVGGEPLEQDAWNVDVALTASQKALGAPPGLAVVLAGPRAMAAWRARKQPVRSLYLDFAEWLPIHEAYEAEKPSYFATPPVNLIAALDASVSLMLEEGLPARLRRHQRLAEAFRAAWSALGLTALPAHGLEANTLSAIRYPSGVDASLVKAVAAQGVVLAGGLHPQLKTTYFRVGHMGRVSPAEVVTTVSAIERALVACGAKVDLGAGLAAAQRALMTPTT